MPLPHFSSRSRQCLTDILARAEIPSVTLQQGLITQEKSKFKEVLKAGAHYALIVSYEIHRQIHRISYL